ncbi:hypothetical protein HAX54_004051 [Datura stramonium]|uniref:Uncharacterized protein n=1 Tax=Datura stramonium TaxID=4076 RepID=A0ABS8T6D5_DATST|nr:hypothetical protein [Datura stramonium]
MLRAEATCESMLIDKEECKACEERKEKTPALELQSTLQYMWICLEKMLREHKDVKIKSESSESCEKVSKKHRKEKKAHGLRGKPDSLESPTSGEFKKSPRSYNHKHSISKDVEDGIGAFNQVKKPDHIISERKQQRDAVDALLSSALISSNKSRSSLRSLPAKRMSSPNAGGPPIRPPKQNKGGGLIRRRQERRRVTRMLCSRTGGFLANKPAPFLRLTQHLKRIRNSCADVWRRFECDELPIRNDVRNWAHQTGKSMLTWVYLGKRGFGPSLVDIDYNEEEWALFKSGPSINEDK